MALDEPKVTSNSFNLNSYTFDELQDAFDDLAIEFEKMNSKHKKMISKLKIENDLLLKSKIEFENKNKDLKNYIFTMFESCHFLRMKTAFVTRRFSIII